MILKVSAVLAGLLLVLLVGMGIYIGYRYWSVNQVRGRPLGASFEGIAPVYCLSMWSGFNNSGSASIYIAHGMVRADINAMGSHGPLTMHLIFDADKSLYMWDEGDAMGEYYPTGAAQANSQILSSLMQNIDHPLVQTESCTPWWSADNSLFTGLATVDFQTFQH